MSEHIFISYSRVDEIAVGKLYRDLVTLGIDCWLDVNSISSGADWDLELQRAIENCSHFIVICTPTSMASKNVKAEWQYAFELGKPIHPFVLEPCSIPFRLRIYQIVEVSDLGYEDALTKLVETLPVEARQVPQNNVAIPGISKIESLINRSVENWQAFGLLLDNDAFKYIDETRAELTELDAAALELIYLSSRRRGVSGDYWIQRVRAHEDACDNIEDSLIDGLNRTQQVHDLQASFEILATPRLVAKFSRILEFLHDDLEIELLLDTLVRVITNSGSALDLTDLERILLKRFAETPNKSYARALGWLNSKPFFDEAVSILNNQVPSIVFDPKYHPYLVGLVNMRMQSAVQFLEQFAPESFGFIPAGWCTIGLADRSSLAAHEVFVPSFWLAKTPVTESEFNQHRLLPHEEKLQEKPISNISWAATYRFIEKLKRSVGLPFSLPSEVMWEKAASWHPAEQRKLEFPWGDVDDSQRCNTVDSGPGHITVVGHYVPLGDSPYGIHDMLGNVWEWTSSIWIPYPYHARDGREASSTSPSTPRVLRGSSFFAKRGFYDGCEARAAFEESYAFHDAGMRLAIVIDR